MTDAEVTVQLLVEEPSTKQALGVILPKIVPNVPFEIVQFQGKQDLLKRLPGLLKGYAVRLEWELLRIVVVIDRDLDDCAELKRKLVRIADDAGLPRSAVLFRIAIDELESWFLGDVPALCAAYPRVPANLGEQARYRDPDATGKALRALEHVLKSNGYHRDHLAKVKAAVGIGVHMDVEANRSRSFQVFRDGLRRLVSEGS
ncbi:DUF4276 family protein [Amycolatopsis minnesotensis]|uniref:DUF4276 family protein n=1 Tax=Amycolatopsis minnesotensis TaxID=337894 RepID=A0ABP5DV59_9PSEU